MNKSVKKTITQLEKGLDITNIQLAEALQATAEGDYVTEDALDEALQGKADLVGGKVPAEQLPSYVDDIIDFQAVTFYNNLFDTIGIPSYENKLYFVEAEAAPDQYANKFVNTGNNTAESDWVVIEPEDGKIYLSVAEGETQNHSWRWSGTQLVDLDKQFADEIAALNNKTYSIIYGSVSDRQDLTTGSPGQGVLRVIYETLVSSTVYSLMSIRFSNNGVSYVLPLFDVDPSEHSFRIYNDGALQKYQVTLSGSTYTFTQLESNGNVVFISEDSAANIKALENLDTSKNYPCLITYQNIPYSTFITYKNSNFYAVGSGNTGRIVRFTINPTTGVIIFDSSIDVTAIYHQGGYTNAGGNKSVSQVYSEMANVFTANWVTVKSTSLGTTISDTTLQTNLENASAIVITYPDESPLILTRGEKLSDRVNFLGIASASGGNHIIYRVVYMTATHTLSVRDTVYSYDTYTYYKNAGGTKTEAEFKTNYIGAVDGVPSDALISNLMDNATFAAGLATNADFNNSLLSNNFPQDLAATASFQNELLNDENFITQLKTKLGIS